MRFAAGAAALLLVALPLAATRANDARETIALSAAEAEDLRAGMRGYLESVQGIVEGLATAKPALVATQAQKSGAAMLDSKVIAAGLAMPAGFIAMSLATHRQFDDLARIASAGAPRLQLLAALNDILANCTSCHAAYRLRP